MRILLLSLFMTFVIILSGVILSPASAETTNVTGTVTRISVDIKDEGGKYRVVIVDDSNILKQIKVGDSVEIILVDGTAVWVKTVAGQEGYVEEVNEMVEDGEVEVGYDDEYEDTEYVEENAELYEDTEYTSEDDTEKSAEHEHEHEEPTIGEAVDSILDLLK